MPRTRLVVESEIVTSPRVMQALSLFDIPPSERSSESWDVHLPLEERDWQVGLIVGPSGSGKSTVARALFGDAVRIGFNDWPADRSILDAMPQGISIKDITGALTGVGFGSPPNWLRPYRVLSMGEQFRVTMARALLEPGELVVIDEFTSVVDRQVAQIASHCVQKAVRRSNKRFIAVTCHYDVLEWLQPDWVYTPQTNSFQWRSLQRRPELQFDIYRIDKSAWKLFAKYHYLSSELHNAAVCFGGFINGECVAFSSYLHLPHPRTRNIKQGHRLVVRPDYQGLGLGGRFDDWLGQWLYERGYRYHNTVAHPAMIAYYSRSPRWKRVGVGGSGPGVKREHVGMKYYGERKGSFAATQPQQQCAIGSKGKQTSSIEHTGAFHWTGTNLKSGKNAETSLRKTQMQLRRLNTVTFEYVPPAETGKK